MSDNTKLHITFKHTDATEPLKQYADEKISKCLNKFFHRETDVNLVLHVEKNRQIAEISFNHEGMNFHNNAESEDMYKTIDELVNTLTVRVRRHKEKVTKHH